ncbi:MAG: ATPase [Lachnospiraceae bacterium]|nr:ATPase [Lachnospiraceae bacterium]
MIEKMTFVTLTGPKYTIDQTVERYLTKYDIHLENAMVELSGVTTLKPFVEVNPYKDKAAALKDYISKIPDAKKNSKTLNKEESLKVLQDIRSEITSLETQREELLAEQRKQEELLDKIEPFRKLQYDIHSILDFRFIKFRFGRIPHEHFSAFSKYVIENNDAIFFECDSDSNYVWGVYFLPAGMRTKTDAIYSSLHFERVYIPDEYQGTPAQAYEQIKEKLEALNHSMELISNNILSILESNQEDLLAAYQTLSTLNETFDIRKLAACTKENNQVFYILCGWMGKSDFEKFEKEASKDADLIYFVDDDFKERFAKTPTRLKNPKFFKPFELLLRMYGMPAYHEFDPTIFVAISYAFIFGFMFGDVGQGLFLVVGGFLLYKFKKMDLAAVVSFAGVFSTMFGFLFGSVFGFENVIDALWLHPMKHMTQIPLIGNLNTVFIVTIAFGMGLTLLTMIFHIINGIKAKDMESIFFDANGVAGLVFYGALVLCIVLYMTSNPLPATIVLVVMFVIPLIMIAFKEPIMAAIEKKAEIFPKEKGMFFVQMFFELFEIMLSYFSNTLSFVRIGAFAVSHAAMMEVVLMLAGAENGASPNWLVVVLGNLFVCGMEGLIVGIQVLRLEYYELFSRFYKGTGKVFKPFFAKKENS